MNKHDAHERVLALFGGRVVLQIRFEEHHGLQAHRYEIHAPRTLLASSDLDWGGAVRNLIERYCAAGFIAAEIDDLRQRLS